MLKPVRTFEKPERYHRRPKPSPRSRIIVLLFVLTSLSGLVYTGRLPSAQAATSTSWNPKVQCTPQIVRITDITANKTGSSSFTASPFNPGETTTVSGGDAKRWLTPSASTPTGWHSPGPSCANSNGQALFVEIDGVERASISVEDGSSTYDPVNGGGQHPGSTTTYDNTFNIFDPAVVPNFSGDCSSASDPTCPGRIHSEIDHDWLAASYCGSGTTCDPSTFASQVHYASTKFDIQGFVYWDPGHVSANYHNFNGWEIHPVTAWRISGQPDFNIATNPSSVSFVSGATGTFTTTISGSNGFTGSVSLTTSSSPSGVTTTCNPLTISGGSGSSQCTLSSSTPGAYTVTVTGKSSSPSITHSATVSVNVNPPSNPDFSISANPNSLSIVQGSSKTSTISLNSISGFSGNVALSSNISPTGPSTILNPTSVSLTPNGSGSSVLNVTASSASTGSYTVTVTGTSNSISHTATVTVSVTPPPDFTISANPTSLTLGQGSTGTMTPFTVTTSGDRTWFESSYLADSFYAQGLIWLFYEDSSVNCEGMGGCLFYTSSPTGSSWATPTNLNVHVTDSDFSVFTDGLNVYYARYDESTFESTCGMNIYFRTGTLQGSSATINWQSEQVALKGLSTNTYPNEEIIVDSTGQAWIAFLSDSHSACKGNGTDLPQIIHSSGTNYASWTTTPFTLSTAHSNNWHIALVSLGGGQIYASYWLANADLHGSLYNGTRWGIDEQISPSSTKNDVNAWLFNSGSNVYAIYFDNNPETFNFASRSSSGSWTNSVIGVGESRTGSSFSSSYYSFPDAASYDPTHNQFYLFWMNATLQRIDQWKGIGNTWTKTTKIVGTAAAPYPDSITSFITGSPTNSFPTTGGIFYVTGSGSLFTYNFVALPLSGSSSGTFTVTVTSQNGFSGTVSLTISINPSTGLVVNCSPTTITGGSGQATCTAVGSTPGSYNVTVTGTSGSLSHGTSVTVIVQGSTSDFAISSNPNSVTMNSGSNGSSTITVTPLSGFTGTVNLTVTTNSTSLPCTLSTSTISGSGTSTLTCHSSPAGNYLATVTGTSGTLAHSTTATFHVQDFTLASNPTSVSTVVSTAGSSAISASPVNGFSATVSLAVSTNSTNLSCTLSANTITGGSGTSTLSCSSSVAGNYLATITGSSGTLSHSATVTYHVKAAQDFTLAAAPSSTTQNAGTAGNSTITVAPLNGFTGTVNLAVTVNSTSLQCALNPTSVSGGTGSSTLSCTSTSAGNYLATVTGSSGALSHSAGITYHVQNFAITANPTTNNVGVGIPGNSTITVIPSNGFSGTVSFTVAANSTALVCSLSTTTITGGSGTSNLSCTSTLPGNYLANVTGTSSNLAHAVGVTYHVTVILAKDFTISANPMSVSVDASIPGNSTITITPVNGFTGTVTLSAVTNSTGLTCTLSPSTITGGSGKSILSCRGSPVGGYQANVTATSGTLSHSTVVSYQAEDFTVSGSPTSVTIQASPSTGNSTITVSSQNGFSNSVALTTTSNSTSITCTLSLTTVHGGSGSSTLSCGSGVAGNYLTTIVASDGTVSHSTTVTYHIQDFRLSAAPTSISVNVGKLGNSTATIASLNGFADTVTLSASTNSVNLSCALSSANISSGSGTSTLSCSSSVQGRYSATITGTSGSLVHSAVVLFTVTAPDFTISANPASMSLVQGAQGASNVTLASVNGFSGSLSLTASVSSTGLVVGLNPAIVTLPPNGLVSSMLSLNSTGAAPGTYSVNVTATGGSLSHSLIITVTITSPVKPSAYALIVSYEGFVYKLYPNNTLVQVAQPVTTQLSVVAWRPDGSCAIIAGNAAVLIKYDGTTLTTVPTGIATSVNFLSAAWRPDGSYALIGGSGGVLLKYDCNTVSQVPNSFAVSFRAVSWKPDSSQALLVTYFGKIYQYSAATGTIIQLTSPTSQNLDAVGWNPNGSYALISGSGGAVLRYDGTSLTVLNTAGVYSSTLTVRYISFNPTGSLALLVGDSGLVLTYDGTTLSALPAITTSTLYSVSWSNGTAYIAGGVGALITYAGGTETSIPNSTFSGFRSIAWKP